MDLRSLFPTAGGGGGVKHHLMNTVQRSSLHNPYLFNSCLLRPMGGGVGNLTSNNPNNVPLPYGLTTSPNQRPNNNPTAHVLSQVLPVGNPFATPLLDSRHHSTNKSTILNNNPHQHHQQHHHHHQQQQQQQHLHHQHQQQQHPHSSNQLSPMLCKTPTTPSLPSHPGEMSHSINSTSSINNNNNSTTSTNNSTTINNEKIGQFQFTVLQGEKIACFAIGGEQRLCLPQVLPLLPNNLDIDQIDGILKKLSIICSVCKPGQLEILKSRGVLPTRVQSCGLITKSDAERLCKHLLSPTRQFLHDRQQKQHNNQHTSATSSSTSSESSSSTQINVVDKDDENNDNEIGANNDNHKDLSKSSQNNHSNNNINDNNEIDSEVIPVVHDCFGKQLGKFYPNLYIEEESRVVECNDCRILFTPTAFVGHSHKPGERNTIHWGFDSANWRHYLFLADEPKNHNYIQAKTAFEKIKNRFLPEEKIINSITTTTATSTTTTSASYSAAATTAAAVVVVSPTTAVNMKTNQVQLQQQQQQTFTSSGSVPPRKRLKLEQLNQTNDKKVTTGVTLTHSSPRAITSATTAITSSSSSSSSIHKGNEPIDSCRSSPSLEAPEKMLSCAQTSKLSSNTGFDSNIDSPSSNYQGWIIHGNSSAGGGAGGGNDSSIAGSISRQSQDDYSSSNFFDGKRKQATISRTSSNETTNTINTNTSTTTTANHNNNNTNSTDLEAFSEIELDFVRTVLEGDGITSEQKERIISGFTQVRISYAQEIQRLSTEQRLLLKKLEESNKKTRGICDDNSPMVHMQDQIFDSQSSSMDESSPGFLRHDDSSNEPLNDLQMKYSQLKRQLDAAMQECSDWRQKSRPMCRNNNNNNNHNNELLTTTTTTNSTSMINNLNNHHHHHKGRRSSNNSLLMPDHLSTPTRRQTNSSQSSTCGEVTTTTNTPLINSSAGPTEEELLIDDSLHVKSVSIVDDERDEYHFSDPPLLEEEEPLLIE